MRRLILCLLLLSGCAAKLSSPQKPKLDLPLVEPLVLENIHFVVIHKDNAHLVFDKMQKEGKAPVLIGLSGTDYKNLSVNIQKIQNYLREQNKTLILYKEYYENSK